MSDSESEFSLAAFSDDEKSCSEFEDHVEVADSSDSDFSDDENSLEPSEMMSSKNGQINFSKTPLVTSAGRASRENIISLIPGLTRYSCSRITEKEISSFELFFPPPLIRTILTYTNIEGKRIYGEEWLDIENIELFAFIGLLILAGVFRSNNESCESLWNPETGRPIFAATMPLKTFKKISRVIRFDNRETRSERRSLDKFAPIRDLWNQWVEILPKLYNPTENVTIDEQLVAFRGRCPFRQYMPAKPAKYGIKFWVLWDSTTSYVWNLQPYTGKAIGRTPEKNQGIRVALDLIEGLKGHNLTTDNFFTSYQLAQKLLEKRITIVGTIRKNKPELPPDLVNIKRRPLNSSIFAFTEQTTLVSYIPKKNRAVILLSTLHHDSKISNRRDKKPEIILDYNKCKGGVDTLDKAVSGYTCKRMTKRWPQVVFSNIIDISAYNAFVLFKFANHAWKEGCLTKRRFYLENLGMQLVTPYIKKRQTLPRAHFSLEIAKKYERILNWMHNHHHQVNLETRRKRK
ncbi:piggyBac transposable element-derived protein 4-like [Anastrepha ludens]|uniref:piggyBac transposable element-derived protein 4-like n=1 Tax=Anastrepha ludens TaxID=28586 RepID=UPI0023AE9143|nr:piggyBac transposable element-derived protein 4-like [Anastrepha ludens]